jgi:maltooligosyltrehalose trehalohydrolase
VTALQNHDQVGNRARGERLHHLVGLDHTLAAAAIALCAPTVPLLFQGEEWASGRPFPYFTDHADADLARAVSEGRRREFAEFGWHPDEVLDPQDPATFEMAVLDWTVVEEGAHARVLRWYQDLIALRRSHPDLTDGDRVAMEVDADPGTGSVRIRRGAATVVANLGKEPASVSAEGALHLRSEESAVEVVEDGSVRLAPGSAAVMIRS